MDTPINDNPIVEETPIADSTSSPQVEDALAKAHSASSGQAERERAEYLAGWQRAKADFINYKKDEMKRLEEFSKYQTEDIIREFIGVIDNFELAMMAIEKMPAPTPAEAGSEFRPERVGIEKGIYIIKTQIEDILKRRGLTRITIRAGDPFDPSVAEAIAEVDPRLNESVGQAPADREFAPGSIVEEIEAGYRLHDKVVRPARVKVAK